MQRNLGSSARIARLVAVLPLTACAVMAPLPLPLRLLAFGAPALYLLGTSVFARCLGYALMGRNTCPMHSRAQ